MSLSSTQLWQRITTAGLASPMQCRAWASEAAASLPAGEAADAQRLAAVLVTLGKLTAFQADTILSGSDQPLVIHGWRILEPVASPEHPAPDARAVWLDWWQAAKGPATPVQWLRWLGTDELKSNSLAAAQPSLPLILRHSQIKSPLLQRVDAPEMSSGQLQLSLEPLAGKLLSSLCDGKPRPLPMVWRMLTDVASALAALHAAGLAHGRVTPDRIVIGDDGRCRLMRDPLCGSTMSIEANSGSGIIAARLPAKLSAAHFMAPEFLAPTPAASPATDCYGLGAIAWLLLAGQPPFAGRSPENIMSAHAEQPLEPNRLAAQPEPVVRCLMHCLAKNPAARFATATALLRAVEEVSRVIAQGKVPMPSTASAKTATSLTAHSTGQSPSSMKAELVKPVKAMSAKPEVVKPEVVKPEVVKPEVVKPEVVKPEVVKPEVVKPEVVKPEVVKSEVVKSEVAKAKLPQPTMAMPTASSSAVVTQPIVSRPDVSQVAATPTQTANTVATANQAKPTASPAAPTQVSAAPSAPVVRRPVRRPIAKRKKTNPWLTPMIGGGGVVVLLLVLLLFRGGAGGNSSTAKKPATTAGTNANSAAGSTGSNTSSASDGAGNVPSGTTAASDDPRGELFELVGDNSKALWAPPRVPTPIPLDLLPPGGQIFIALRPQLLLTGSDQQTLLKLLEPDLQPMWQWLNERSGVEPKQISELVVAAYSGAGNAPQYAARIELVTPQSAGDLKTAWKNPTETKKGNQSLWTSGQWSYFLSEDNGTSSPLVSRFSVGPTELMQDVAASQGAAGPLPAALERLLLATDRQSELNVLLVPSFLFTDGRPLLSSAPPRASSIVSSWMERDMRGASLAISLQGDAFYELRLVGASDRDATPNQQRLREALSKMPQQVESWFVEAMPHAYWRAVALRYPNMLRALATQTRVGAEAGQAIANGYLPASALQNIIYASWMAVQPEAISGGGSASQAVVASDAPLTAEQILERPISLVVDQQGIEVVLALIGEQANEKLPAGSRPLKFELDGPGFQRAGFTRNQQVKDFKINGQSVRAALTELARRQNPVPGVQDLKSAEQKMVWLLLNPDKPDQAQVSLTSREAATNSGLKLPVEFAP